MLKQRFFLKYVSFLLVIILLCSGLSVSVLSVDTESDSVLLDDIGFWCYDGRDHGSSMKEAVLREMMNCGEEGLHDPVDVLGSANDEYGTLSLMDLFCGPLDSAWPMKCHDNCHTGLSPYSTSDNNGAELWRFKCSWVEGGPVIDSDGTIYFGDTWGTLYALYPDGELSWKFEEFNGRITSSPVIGEDGTIYIGSWDHYFYALNSDGTLKWRVELGRTITSSPAIGEDGTIYTGTMGNKIYAIYPNGTVKWEYKTGSDIIGDPAIGDDGTIYIGSWDTYLYAMNPDGTLKWRFKTDHYIKGPPSIDDDGTIYVGSYDDYLYALHPDGSLKWQCKIGYGAETNPSIGPDGTIYVGGEKLYAINPDGTVKWTFDLGADQDIFQSSPAISADGTIYVGTNIGEVDGGDIIAVNPDGTLRWRHRISNSGWVDSSPCIDANGIVYIGSSEANSTDFFGHLYAFGPGELNNPPDQPTIQGDTNGKIGETYTYTISGTDPDNDMISYFVDWGDGSNSGWQGPYDSGTSIELSHSWSERGSYMVKAKVRDSEGSESNWATSEVSMPKNKDALFDSFLARLFHVHPHLFSLIEHLL